MLLFVDPDVAKHRFGLLKSSLGTVYTRTGRQFFEHKQTEIDFLEMLNKALTESNFWDRFRTDWVCLDGELMPWSAKAKELLIKQYAAVGSAATAGLTASITALTKAKERGIVVEHLISDFDGRKNRIEKYITAYRNYCRDTNGIEGLVYAPFHILGTEGNTYFDKQHTWHLENIDQFCTYNSKHLMVTANILVDLQNQDSTQQAIAWWTALTSKGGEGMVVKPLDYITSFKGRTVQPAMKCRGSEYLRSSYGPEYDTTEKSQVWKDRNVKVKRDLAIKEYTLGLESLDRFVHKEPLRRIHECIFGILAIESESVDPRL